MTSSPPPPPSSGPRVSHDQVRDLSRLRRAREGRMVAGVCEGLSRHLDIDPLLIRVVFGALTIFGGAGIVLYVIAWLTIPDDAAHDSWASHTFHQEPERMMVLGLSLAAIAGAVTLLGAIGFATPRPWAVITVSLVALVLFTLFSRRGGDRSYHAYQPPLPYPPGTRAPETTQPPETTQTDGAGHDTGASSADTDAGVDATSAIPSVTPAQRADEVSAWWQRGSTPAGPGSPVVPGPTPPIRPPRPRSRLTPMTLAVMVLTLGGIWSADILGANIHPSVYPGSVLGLTAAALLLGSWYGRAKLLIPIGLISAFLTAAFTVIGPGPYGERFYEPTTAAEVKDVYHHGAGRMVVNLEDVRDINRLDGRTITVESRVGLVQVIVPTSLDAEITSQVDGGDIKGPAVTDDTGNGSQESVMSARQDGRPLVTIDVDLRYGQIEILRLDCRGLAVPRHSDTTAQDLSTLTWEGDASDPAACN